VAACQAFEALDDYPGQIDQTPPTGVEDEPPAEGSGRKPRGIARFTA
jgi:hypothetical protein